MNRKPFDYPLTQAELAEVAKETWCDKCNLADLGVTAPREVVEDHRRFVVGQCAKCGTETRTELTEMPSKKAEFEQVVRKAIGHKIKTIRYFDHSREGKIDPAPEWNLCRDIGHTLNFGLDLEFADGLLLGWIWDSSFDQYGVGVKLSSIGDDLRSYEKYDVSAEREWKPYLGQEVVAANIFWETKAGNLDYPQTVQLSFENGRSVWISATEIQGPDSALSQRCDNISVFFEDTLLLANELLPS